MNTETQTIESGEVARRSEVAQAMQTVIKALREDKSSGSWYYGWQSNIAMAFYDTFMQYIKTDDKVATKEMCNEAARRFLDQLIYPYEKVQD